MSDNCYFCLRPFAGIDGPRHIVSEHRMACFECMLCSRMVCADLETGRRHLDSEHGVEIPMPNTQEGKEKIVGTLR